MVDPWLPAKRGLIQSLIEMGPRGVLQVQPPGGRHWTQIVRAGRELHVTTEDHLSLSLYGLEWSPEQIAELMALGWNELAVPGLPYLEGTATIAYAAAFSLEEPGDLADTVIGLYSHAVRLDPRDPLWSWDGRSRVHLHTGEPGPIFRTQTGRLGDLVADNTDLEAFATQPISCFECGWTGIGRDSLVCEFSVVGAELECPECPAYLGFSIFPWARTSPSRS